MHSGAASPSPIEEINLFTIPDTQDELDIISIPDTEVNCPTIEVSFAHHNSLLKDLSNTPETPSGSTRFNLFAIPNSPTLELVSPSTELDLFDIPDTPKSLPIPTDGRVPDSPSVPPQFIHPGQDPVHMQETEVFDVSDSPLSPMADLMDFCDIPNSPILAAEVHPGIQNPVADAGPSIIDTQLQEENTAERPSLKTIGRNLIPYLPIILSRASLLRAQLAQLITEKDFIKGQIDGALTRVAEVDRYLYGLRALQLMRQEGRSDEEAAM